MPSHGTRREIAAVHKFAQGAISGRRLGKIGTTESAKSARRTATSTAAAKQFVDRHVHIDKQGFPSLLPTAVKGISDAVSIIHGDYAKAPSAVEAISGQGPSSVRPLTSEKEIAAARRKARQDLGLTTQKEQQQESKLAKQETKGIRSYQRGAAKRTRVATTPLTKTKETGGGYAFGSPYSGDVAGKGGEQVVKYGRPVVEWGSLLIPGTGEGRALLGGLRAATKEGATVGLSEAARGAVGKGVTSRTVQGAGRALRNAPRAAKKAVTEAPRVARRTPATVASVAGTSTGRRELARTVGRTAVEHKAVTAPALLATAHKSGVNVPGGKQAAALIEGTKNALLHHPLQTGKTTARTLPGAITAPVALGASAFESARAGDLGPLKKEAQTQFEGVAWAKGKNKKGHEKRGMLEGLLSGNPKVVENTVRSKAGLAFLPIIPGLSRTRAYKAARGEARAAAAGIRRKAEPALRAEKWVHPRLSPAGVERPIFSVAEKRQGGMRIMKHRAMAEGPFHMAAAEHGKNVIHAAGSLPKRFKQVPEALQTLLANGIRNQRGVDYIRKHGPTSEETKPGAVNLKYALDVMAEHPDAWTHPKVKRFIAEAERATETTPAQLAGVGEVARVGEQAAAHRNRYQSEGKPIPQALLHPTEQVPPEARPFTKATTREAAWKDAKGDSDRAKKLRAALEPYTRPEQSQDFAKTKRTPYSEQMRNEHVAAVEAENKKAGLVPAKWTHHTLVREGGAGTGEMQYPRAPGPQEHSRGAADNPESLAARDLVDRSFHAFIKGTVEMPRRRAGGKAFARSVVQHEVADRYPIEIDGERKNVVRGETEKAVTRNEYIQATAPKNRGNPNGGQYDRASMGFFPFDQVKNSLNDPFTRESDFQKLLDDAASKDTSGHGNELGFMLPRHQIEEWRAAIQGDLSKISNLAAGGARFATAGILGTNPAWAMTQIPAEGIPGILAHPEFLLPHKIPSLELSLHAIRKTDPELAYKFEGMMGASPDRAGALRQASDTAGRYGQIEAPDPIVLEEEGKRLTRGKFGRALDSVKHLRPLRTFDVRRQREYRSVTALAEADKRFRSFRSGLKKAISRETTVAGKFRGRSRQEMVDWLMNTEEGRREAMDIRHSLDDVFGNWDSFTKWEREIAPFTIFYSFLRYAVTWPLWTFPRSHPLTAEIAYFLAQQNANRLEQIMGQPPTSGSEYLYALPVFTSGKKKKDGSYYQAALPSGTRISPGQSVIQGAVMSKNPGQVLGSLNPFIGAAITGATGVTPFGTKSTQPRGWAAASQLFPGLSALRYTAITPQRAVHALTNAKTPDEFKSVLAEAFDRLDPKKSLRSFAMPWLPTSAAKVKQKNRLAAALTVARENGSGPRDDVIKAAATAVYQAKTKAEAHKLREDAAKQVELMHGKATRAGKAIDSILKDLGLGQRNKKEFSILLGISKQAREGFGGSGGGGSSKSPKPTTTVTTTQGGVTTTKTTGPGMKPTAYTTGPKATPAQAAAQGAKAKSKGIEGPLTDSQKAFGAELSKQTGLSPRVVGAWMLAEDSGGAAASKQAAGDQNWLNIGPGAKLPNDPKKAAQATAHLINTSSNYSGIRAAAKSGNDSKQLQAIGNSPWGTVGSSLPGTYALVKGAGPTRAQFKPTAPPALQQRFGRLVKLADHLNNAGIPYVWGGQHGLQKAEGPKQASGYDCSGAVSWLLQKAGVKIPVLTSGQLATTPALKNGPGAVTVYANGTHTFLKIGNRFWGTSASNPGGGPGWIAPRTDLASFTARHIPGLGPKQAKLLGAKLVGGDTTGGGSVGGGGGGISGIGGISSGSSGGSSGGSSSSSSSTYTPPDYVGLTSSTHAISPITGIVGSSASSLLHGSAPTATNPLSAVNTLAKLPKPPKVKRKRSR